MQTRQSSKKVAQRANNIVGWEGAITLAQQQIEEARARIRALKQAIRSFEVMRVSGEPWPGTVEVANSEAAKNASSERTP